jgi:hypothetical protein
MIYYRIESRIKRYICGELRMVFKSAGLGERTGLLSRLQVVILIIIPFRRIIGSLSIRVYICYLGADGMVRTPTRIYPQLSRFSFPDIQLPDNISISLESALGAPKPPIANLL